MLLDPVQTVAPEFATSQRYDPVSAVFSGRTYIR